MEESPSVIKFTNCRLAIDDELVWRDLCFSAATGTILNHQSQFFDQHTTPNKTFDLGGRIVSPGFIDVQLNGAFGVDFSVPSERYEQDLKALNRRLVQTGVTSYLPTLTSQRSEVYRKVRPSGPAKTGRYEACQADLNVEIDLAVPRHCGYSSSQGWRRVFGCSL